MSLIYSSIQKKSFRSPKSIVFCDKHHRSREFLTMFNVETLSVELLNVEFRTNGVKQAPIAPLRPTSGACRDSYALAQQEVRSKFAQLFNLLSFYVLAEVARILTVPGQLKGSSISTTPRFTTSSGPTRR